MTRPLKKITDKQRLDWIEKREAEICCDTCGHDEKWLVTNNFKGEWTKTLRESIDAAIALDKPGRRKI